MLHASLPKNIRALRLKQGLSQSALAALAKVSTKYLSTLERSKGSANVGLTTMTAIASALGVTVAALLSEKEIPPPKKKPLRRAQKRLIEIAERLDDPHKASALASVGKFLLQNHNTK